MNEFHFVIPILNAPSRIDGLAVSCEVRCITCGLPTIHSDGIPFPASAHLYLAGANRLTNIFGVPRRGGDHARSSGFTGGERYVGINCEDNSSPGQARRNDRGIETERSQYAGVPQLRCGQRRC
jgi:hypothetical protein